MNDFTRKMIMDHLSRMDGRMRDYARDRRDMNDQYDGNDYDDYARGRRNARRGANGRYISDRADNANHMDGNDMDDFDYAQSDYHKHAQMRLRKADMLEWKRDMENFDGSVGAHFSMDEVMRAAQKMNIKFDSFNEKEFCLTVNMIYSDFGKAIRRIGGAENELMNCVDFAKLFLDDADGPEGYEKLALYYYFIVCYGKL